MALKLNVQMYKFGLVGKDIAYSFSRAYFTEKFEKEKLTHSYVNFDLKTISKFPEIFQDNGVIKGLNVTIPYKEAVIPYLDKLHKKAKAIGAVNTIKISKKGKLIGYNTDCYGFKKSIKPLLKPHHTKALILGTGGASKAIVYVLKKLGITYSFVSRQSSNKNTFTYNTLSEEHIKDYTIIINCTPLGTFPKTELRPDIPYDALTENHLLYDLVYNPTETTFLKLGKAKGATICNGKLMLEGQAEKAWDIWN